MSGIAGIQYLAGRPPAGSSLAGLARAMVQTLAYRGPDRSDVFEAADEVGLGHCLRRTTPEDAFDRQPLVFRDPSTGRELVLVADARIDNREELLRELAGDELLSGDPNEIPDSAFILAAYRRFGVDCPDRLLGDFAFAVWDGPQRRWFCACDPFGVRQLHYHYRSGGVFSFATEIKALFAVPGTPRELDEMRVGLYLAAIFADQESTFYEGIKSLPAGHFLVADADGCKVRRYFDLDPKREIRLPNDAAYAEQFRELFIEAVRCRLRACASVSSTLSGGLDSTSIACVARDLLRESGGGPLHTISAIFPSFSGKEKQRIDESAFVADVAAAGGIEPVYVEADSVSPLVDLDRILDLQDEPVFAPNYYMHWAIYGAAERAGVGVILDGLDGDTTVSHGYDHLTDLFRGLRLFRLYREAKALSRNTPHSVGAKRIVRDLAVKPVAERITYPLRRLFRRKSEAPWGELSLVSPEFAAEIGLAERIHDLLGDPPRPATGERAVHRKSLLSPMLAHAFAVADRGTNAHGLEGRYPFCDRRLAEFCLSLPGDQKLRCGMSRFVMRRAMEGILPPSVQWRNTKADLSPSLFQGLGRFEADTLQEATTEKSILANRCIDMPSFRAAVKSYADGGNAEAFRLYGVLALMRWLHRSGFA